MDDTDIVDEVNKLIKLGVGDAYRLEHIKQAYIQNKTLWVTDENYLKRLREKYITNHQAKVQESIDENSHENKETIHCWKCGKKTPLGANFCMVCGSSLFEVGAEHKPERNEISVNPKNQKSSMDLKIPIIVGIPILILIILGGAYSQGYFDNTFEKDTSDKKINSDIVTESKELEGSTNLSDNGNSKCGPGTTLKDGVCELDNRCGPGTTLKDGVCELDK